MSRADAIRAKARRVSAPAAETVAPSSVAAAPVRAKPVRTTLDLAPDLHARWTRWLSDTAPVLGRVKLTTVDVARVLFERLLTDEDLQREVIQELKEVR